MRGTDDLILLESPLPDLMREVTGREPDRSGTHVMLQAAGVRSTQRLALADVGGAVVAFTWPAELVEQAKYLYSERRALTLLAAAREGSWDVDVRPHLAFWRSQPRERLYMNPEAGMTAEEYCLRWSGPDQAKIGGHDRASVRDELWPWLLERGYATAPDNALLDPFLAGVEKRKRDVHLRPGLRLLRRWPAADVVRLRQQGQLAAEIRAAVNRLLTAADDTALATAAATRPAGENGGSRR